MDGTYQIESMLNNNYVLDVTSSSISNGANVQLYESNNTNAQGWKITHDENGYVTFTNVNSGKVLEVSTGKASDSQNIVQNTSDGS